MKVNDLVTVLLRSPLNPIMGDTMLITLSGRKTGRRLSVPVNYYRDGDALWVISSRNRTWWRNLVQGAEVDLHMHGQDHAGYAEVIRDEEAVTARLKDYVCRMPASARALGLRVTDGIPNCEDLARAARERLFIRVCVQA